MHIASSCLKKSPTMADWRSTTGSYNIYSKTALYMNYGLVFSVFNSSLASGAIRCSGALFINQPKLRVIRIHLLPPEYSRKTKD